MTREGDRWAKHYTAGCGGAPRAPGTHRKEWPIRNGQKVSWGEAKCPQLMSSIFPHIDSGSWVVNLLLQVAFTGGLADLRWEDLRWAFPGVSGTPPFPFRYKVKENNIALLYRMDFLSDKIYCFLPAQAPFCLLRAPSCPPGDADPGRSLRACRKARGGPGASQ